MYFYFEFISYEKPNYGMLERQMQFLWKIIFKKVHYRIKY